MAIYKPLNVPGGSIKIDDDGTPNSNRRAFTGAVGTLFGVSLLEFLSGCLGKSEGAGAYAEKQGPYSYVPGPVNPNPDMSDPYKVVEEAVDAIKANDYKAFERLLTPDFKAQIGGEAELKELVQEQHDKMFEKRAGNDARINNFADEKDVFYIQSGPKGGTNAVQIIEIGNEFRIAEW